MEGPLDRNQEKPFSVFSYGKNVNEKPGFKKINLTSERDIEKVLGRKIKKLDIGDRYLESFIKEMV